MNNKKESMNIFAKNIEDFLNADNCPPGFALFIFEFHKPGITYYISNANREDMILALKETIKRFENRENIKII